MSTVREVRVCADEAPTPAPFFIVGSGRSGTTLLRMMLCSHSRISIPPETWYLIPLLDRFSIDRPLTAAEIESAVSIITSHYRWPDLKLDAQEFRRELSQLTEPDLRDVAEIVHRWHMRAEGKARWGDKTPVYVEIVPGLAGLFPGSRFIFLVRDGRDVAKSFQATHWVSRWLHENTREWIRALECQQRWTASEVRQRILLVRYEDLVLETPGTLAQVCRFIGEEFEPQMLAWQGHVDERIPARESGIHKKLKLRIDSKGVNRWKREMSAREIFVCEAFMGTHLTRMGYERRYRSSLWAPAFALTRLYCRIVLPLVDIQMKALHFLRVHLARALGAR
jgi:Sulfotransferase family